MGLEVVDETAKQVFIKAGNLNWGSLSLVEQDIAMFEIIVLVITTATPSKSILMDNPYRNVARKKLQSYLDSPTLEPFEVKGYVVPSLSFHSQAYKGVAAL